jgi:hypothetical protein
MKTVPGGISGTVPTSSATRFEPALGELREHCFEGMAQFGDMSGEKRREWFIRNGNFFIE